MDKEDAPYIPREEFDELRAAVDIVQEKASVPNPRSGSKSTKAHTREIEEQVWGDAMTDAPASGRR
jgi:hypothetical protein